MFMNYFDKTKIQRLLHEAEQIDSLKFVSNHEFEDLGMEKFSIEAYI